jgi:tungstate transport system permease protein
LTGIVIFADEDRERAMLDQLSAWQLILNGDAALYAVVRLSLAVSLAAVALAAVIGMPLGALLALTRFPGRSVFVVFLNAMMGLPPVVVRLAVYLLLGALGILFTPAAMVLVQTVLVVPIIAALTRQTVEDLWVEYRDELAAMDVGPVGRMARCCGTRASACLRRCWPVSDAPPPKSARS